MDSQAQVLQHRQVFDQSYVLMDEPDAGPAHCDRIAVPDFLTGNLIPAGPGIGLVEAGDHFDERRLSRPVVSEERVDLARRYIEINRVECLLSREALRDSHQLQGRGRRRHHRGLRPSLS